MPCQQPIIWRVIDVPWIKFRLKISYFFCWHGGVNVAMATFWWCCCWFSQYKPLLTLFFSIPWLFFSCFERPLRVFYSHTHTCWHFCCSTQTFTIQFCTRKIVDFLKITLLWLLSTKKSLIQLGLEMRDGRESFLLFFFESLWSFNLFTFDFFCRKVPSPAFTVLPENPLANPLEHFLGL